jgi:hypothetical protein
VTIQTIIQEQEEAIKYINQRLNVNFDSKVRIYLYNKDEAKEKIGTNGGGYANLSKITKHIYFTFHPEPMFNPVLNKYDYVGVHEMVHIITINKLGKFTTRFFGEGYANAVDGNYGIVEIDGIWNRRRNDSTMVKILDKGMLLKPSDLLYKDSLPEHLYYPQIGYLINWMFDTYGVDKINQLYDIKRDKIEEEFLEVTGIHFKDMEQSYLEYCGVD